MKQTQKKRKQSESTENQISALVLRRMDCVPSLDGFRRLIQMWIWLTALDCRLHRLHCHHFDFYFSPPPLPLHYPFVWWSFLFLSFSSCSFSISVHPRTDSIAPSIFYWETDRLFGDPSLVAFQFETDRDFIASIPPARFLQPAQRFKTSDKRSNTSIRPSSIITIYTINQLSIQTRSRVLGEAGKNIDTIETDLFINSRWREPSYAATAKANSESNRNPKTRWAPIESRADWCYRLSVVTRLSLQAISRAKET